MLGKHQAKGFTLIELLVVIAIVGILSSVVMGSLNSARGKGRDSQRKTNLKQLQTALELYYNDNFQYPAGGCDANGWSRSDNCPTTYISGLAGTYIASLPVGASAAGYYQYSARGADGYQSYKIIANGVESEVVQPTSVWARCAASCATTSPGTFCANNQFNNDTRYAVSSGGNAYCAY